MGSGAAAIAEVIPEVSTHLESIPPLKPLENPLSIRFRFFDSVTSFFRNASPKKPMVLIFEDLHWADAASLGLLECFAHHLNMTRILIIATYRDTDLNRKHPLWRTLGDLGREKCFERIMLRGLDSDEVRTLIDERSGATETESLTNDIVGRTDGNPLFVGEIIRFLMERGDLAEGNAAPSGTEMTRIPEGVREVIGRRLDSLSDFCNELLTTAAVIGREFDANVLEYLYSDTSEDVIEDAIEEARVASVIE